MRQNRFINWLVFDWPVKAISLLTAVLLFFFVQLITVEHRSFQIPLDVINNSSFVIDSTYPETLEVRISGKQEDVFMIYPEDLVVWVDISEIDETGVATIPVLTEKGLVFDTIGEVQVVTEPAELRVHLDKKVSQ